MGRYVYRYKYLPDMIGVGGVVRDGTIKFTHPSDFNDPFDCMPSSKFGSFQKLNERNPELYAALKSGSGSPADRVLRAERIMRAMREKVISGEMVKLLLAEASVLSLAKTPLSVLMWSHYAKYHSGTVVEFKIPIHHKEFDIETVYRELIPLDVVYTAERPVMEFNGDPASGDESLHQLFLAKSDFWSYEQESRVIKSKGGAGIFSYNHSLINSVIVGARSCDFGVIKSLAVQASNKLGKEIGVYRAEFDKLKYAIKIPRLPRRVDDV